MIIEEDNKFIKKIRKQGVHPRHPTKYDIQQRIKEREEQASQTDSEPKSE
tara:strand:+ start:707 stop:856 length:150 start_codon:yes stop_codon:yes gene_type:complete